MSVVATVTVVDWSDIIIESIAWFSLNVLITGAIMYLLVRQSNRRK